MQGRPEGAEVSRGWVGKLAEALGDAAVLPGWLAVSLKRKQTQPIRAIATVPLRALSAQREPVSIH